MSRARFHLVTGAVLNGASTPTWQIREAGDDDPAGLVATAWRLLGGNNRELGRSATVFPGVTAAREAISELRDRLPEALRAFACDTRTGRWGWRLLVDGEPLATSSRLYLRHRECGYNLGQFLAGVPGAEDPAAEPPNGLGVVIDLRTAAPRRRTEAVVLPMAARAAWSR